MYNNKRFGWLFSIDDLSPRQKWGNLLGIVIGLGVGRLLADRYAHSWFLDLGISVVFALIGAGLGLALTGRNPFAAPESKADR